MPADDKSLKLKSEIPLIRGVEGEAITSLELADFIDNPDILQLSFSIPHANALPSGVMLDPSGRIYGTPQVGTAQMEPYKTNVTVTADDEMLEFPISVAVTNAELKGDLVSRQKAVWEALAKEGIVPESIEELLSRPITKRDVYYLVERFASFVIWNADDMRLAVDGEMISIDGQSDKFNVYDFEVCLVTTPKDLYTHDRVLGDALQTAKAMMREVHKRGWNVEFGGFDRMADAAWYEGQFLNDTAEKAIEIRNYEPMEIREGLFMAHEARKKL